MTKISVIDNALASICDMRQSLLAIYEKQNLSSSDDDLRKAEREIVREIEMKAIDALCSSILFKIESLAYKLSTIKSFDWDKYHNFERHLSEANKIKKEDSDKVRQELNGGRLIVLCKDDKVLENYIFTEVASFFSNISGVIDNVGYLLKYSFNLEIESEEIKIYDVHDRIREPIKNLLYEHLLKDPRFGGMRDVRIACEHRALTQVFPFGRMRALGDRDLGPPNILGRPYVNEDISEEVAKIKKEDRRLDIYCDYLHKKICGFLDQFIATVIKISEITESK